MRGRSAPRRSRRRSREPAARTGPRVPRAARARARPERAARKGGGCASATGPAMTPPGWTGLVILWTIVPIIVMVVYSFNKSPNQRETLPLVRVHHATGTSMSSRSRISRTPWSTRWSWRRLRPRSLRSDRRADGDGAGAPPLPRPWGDRRDRVRRHRGAVGRRRGIAACAVPDPECRPRPGHDHHRARRLQRRLRDHRRAGPHRRVSTARSSAPRPTSAPDPGRRSRRSCFR